MNAKLATVSISNETPCIRNCCLDEQNVCLGCGRSLPEILEWHHADDIRQSKIRHDAKNRLKQRR